MAVRGAQFSLRLQRDEDPNLVLTALSVAQHPERKTVQDPTEAQSKV